MLFYNALLQYSFTMLDQQSKKHWHPVQFCIISFCIILYIILSYRSDNGFTVTHKLTLSNS